LELSKEHTKEICTCIMCFVYCAKYYAAKEEFDKSFKCFQEFFEREKDCNPSFNVRCWAYYNYARLIVTSKDYQSDNVKRVSKQCTKLLRSSNVMNKDLKIGLKEYLRKIKVKD